MQELGGKVAVVTGAGSGIGRGLALRFAQEGMRVVAADIEDQALGSTVAELEGMGVEHTGRVTDVADLESVQGLADHAYDTFGSVDVLCNNAGVFVGGFLWERPLADYEFVLGANLYGILNGIRAFVPRMLAQDTEGHIVNTVSVAGLLGSPYAGPYNISKFAAMAATESLANDLEQIGSKLKVSALCPGIIATNITKSDRNRPERLATATTEDQSFVNAVLDDTVSAGMAPAEVAGIVVDGIRSQRFVILTHEKYAGDIETRAADLVARRLPTFPTFD